MRKILPWLLGAALLAVAGTLTLAIPSDDSLTEPFLASGTVGEEVTTRTLRVIVGESEFTDRLVVPESEWSAEGNWLVVSVEASAPHSETGANIGLATLTIEGVTFQASERPASSLVKAPLHVGTPMVGGLAFELPAGLRTGTAELRLGPTSSTPVLDDVVSIRLNLDVLAATDERELEAPTWVKP